MTEFCNKYIILLEALYKDKELNRWCCNYSAYKKNTEHRELERMIYDGFMNEAYKLSFMTEILSWKPYSAYTLEAALSGTEADLIRGICLEIRSDYVSNGSLISRAIAGGNLYRLMSAFLSYDQKPQYTLEYIKEQECRSEEIGAGACCVRYDRSLGKWHLRVQLDDEQLWYLSVYVSDDGSFETFSLDKEAANDSHYEFVEENKIRNSLYAFGDENKFFHDILIRYVKEHGGEELKSQIMPYVTEQFHFY